MKSRTRKSPENVAGPLWPHSERIAQHLVNRGYARNTIDHQLWLVARLSRWLDEQNLALADLSSSELERFERWRWEHGGSRRKCSLAPIMRYLHEAGEVPEVDLATEMGPVEELIERYRRYLVTERGVARTTVVKYEHVARLFLKQQLSPAGDGIQVPDGSAITRFIAQASAECGVGAAKNRVKGLRSLLRFMHLEGITGNLVDAVPTVAGWRQAQLPKGLEPEQVARLLASCPDTVAGRRGRAIMVLMADAKFGKSRELVLHRSTIDALREYDNHRGCLVPKPRSRAFLVSTVGARLEYNNVQRVFDRLTRRAGLVRRSARCRPRLHDFRHTFAVNFILDWYRAGLDVAQRLHLLSTYLGHTQPSHTYWYLSATPELFALVGQRLTAQLGDLA